MNIFIIVINEIYNTNHVTSQLHVQIIINSLSYKREKIFYDITKQKYKVKTRRDKVLPIVYT